MNSGERDEKSNQKSPGLFDPVNVGHHGVFVSVSQADALMRIIDRDEGNEVLRTFLSPGGRGHTLIVGSSGRGRSLFLEDEARRLGIRYEDLIRSMEHTAEYMKAQRVRQEKQRQVEEARMRAVREAFWDGTPVDHRDMHRLHDVMVACEVTDDPTPTQLKAFFMMLPDSVVASAIRWGFSDTEVREEMYEFVSNDLANVRTTIAAAAVPAEKGDDDSKSLRPDHNG